LYINWDSPEQRNGEFPMDTLSSAQQQQNSPASTEVENRSRQCPRPADKERQQYLCVAYVTHRASPPSFKIIIHKEAALAIFLYCLVLFFMFKKTGVRFVTSHIDRVAPFRLLLGALLTKRRKKLR